MIELHVPASPMPEDLTPIEDVLALSMLDDLSLLEDVLVSRTQEDIVLVEDATALVAEGLV